VNVDSDCDFDPPSETGVLISSTLSLSVTGGTGSQKHVLTRTGTHGRFYNVEGQLTLSNLELRGGSKATSLSCAGLSYNDNKKENECSGGQIRVSGTGATATVQNCVLASQGISRPSDLAGTATNAMFYGGSIFVTEGGTFTATDTLFTGWFTNSEGGAVEILGNYRPGYFEPPLSPYSKETKAYFTRCIFNDNRAKGRGASVGVSTSNSHAYFDDCIFQNHLDVRDYGIISARYSGSLHFNGGNNMFKNSKLYTTLTILDQASCTQYFDSCQPGHYARSAADPEKCAEDLTSCARTVNQVMEPFSGCLWKCPIGTYGDGIESREFITSCKTCTAGHKCSTVGLGDPVPCPAGKYQSDTGKSFCFECPPGKYAEAQQDDVCGSCVPGKFANISASSECLNCDAGMFTKLNGSIRCEECNVGQFVEDTGTAGAKECKKCTGDTYQNMTGQTECKGCPIGYQGGQTQCIECPIGFAGAECEDCQVGMSRSNNDSPTNCVVCGSGSYQSEKGKSVCISCSPGQFSNSATATKCKKCEIDFSTKDYTNTTSKQVQDRCEACPTGQSTLNTKSASECTPCASGKYGDGEGDGDACKKCAVGRYREAADENSDTCRICPAGYYQSEEEKATCLPCLKGKFSNSVESLECVACSAGRFSNTKNASACKECPLGRRLDRTGLTACGQCAVGYFSLSTGNHGACFGCPSGYYTDTPNSQNCHACLQGQITVQTNSSSCNTW